MHNDLGRIGSVDCGTTWGQNFTYDAFGNINKTVPNGGTGIAFSPSGYSASNQPQGLGFQFDSNGNIKNDGPHAYTWDAGNRAITIDASTSVTYDALGRTVEIGGSKQVVYAPDGSKLALMNGQTLQTAFVPLPGGTTVVYTSTGLSYYRHADWLGSSRFSSTPDQHKNSDQAYAPFGETYAQSGSDLSFTGQTQDTVAGLYDFMFRRYSPVQGRWISPDPAGLGAVDPANPQSWNRYAYVLNGPLSFVDPLGLEDDVYTMKVWVHDQHCLGMVFTDDSGNAYCTGGIILWDSGPVFPMSHFDPGSIVAGGDVGGGTSSPPPQPSNPANNSKSAADIARCAARKANSVSLAALLPDGTPAVVSNILGNDFSTISNLITGPGRGSAAVSIAEGKAFNAGVRGVGAIQYTADKFILGTNGAGATFARDMIPGTIAYSLAGKIVTKLSTAKLIYDAATYAGAAAICYASPD